MAKKINNNVKEKGGTKRAALITNADLPTWFRCQSAISKEFVSDEICANRKTNLLVMYPDCKKCEGRNQKIPKKRRAYKRKPKK